MLTMLREIGLNRKEDGSIAIDNFKIVYIAPMKVTESRVQFSCVSFSFGVC